MTQHFDLLTIGGGSGGVAVSNRAGSYGAKCLLIEKARLGGTCVNVGCVPKKVMWNGAQLGHALDDAADYGWRIGSHEFDWATLKRERDGHVHDLNLGYARYLASNKVKVLQAEARFVGPKTVEADGERYSADHVVIATGGHPIVPDLPGARPWHQLRWLLRIGVSPSQDPPLSAPGYIAAELAGVLTVGRRGHASPAPRADPDELRSDAPRTSIDGANARGRGPFVTGTNYQWDWRGRRRTLRSTPRMARLGAFDTLIWAIGRAPYISHLDLAATGLSVDDSGFVARTTIKRPMSRESMHSAISLAASRSLRSRSQLAAGWPTGSSEESRIASWCMRTSLRSYSATHLSVP